MSLRLQWALANEWLPFVHNGRPHGPDPRVERITHNLLRRWTGR